jgi:hypothetical protein
MENHRISSLTILQQFYKKMPIQIGERTLFEKFQTFAEKNDDMATD